MLKKNEKRIFWIVVMAIAAVSLVTSWISGVVVGIENMINSADVLGQYTDSDFRFGVAFLLLTLWGIVAAAVAHLCTKGKHCMKAKMIWAIVIGAYFVLSAIAFTVAYYAYDIGDYADFIEYVTTSLAIAVSYEIAFFAQRMLDTRDSDE